MSDDFILSSRQYKELLRSLRDCEAYGKQADLERNACLRRLSENDEEILKLRNLLREGSELLNEIAALGSCDCDIPNGKTCAPCECAIHNKRVAEALSCGSVA